MQIVDNQELEDREQSINNHFLWSQEKEVEAHREVEELNKEQEELRAKSDKEIEELKKEQDQIIFEKAQLWYCRVQFENVIS